MKQNHNSIITLKELIRDERHISPKQYGVYLQNNKTKYKKKKKK